jgi:hypothetical protein
MSPTTIPSRFSPILFVLALRFANILPVLAFRLAPVLFIFAPGFADVLVLTLTLRSFSRAVTSSVTVAGGVHRLVVPVDDVHARRAHRHSGADRRQDTDVHMHLRVCWCGKKQERNSQNPRSSTSHVTSSVAEFRPYT